MTSGSALRVDDIIADLDAWTPSSQGWPSATTSAQPLRVASTLLRTAGSAEKLAQQIVASALASSTSSSSSSTTAAPSGTAAAAAPLSQRDIHNTTFDLCVLAVQSLERVPEAGDKLAAMKASTTCLLSSMDTVIAQAEQEHEQTKQQLRL